MEGWRYSGKGMAVKKEKNKTVALVWWYKLSQAMTHGGRLKAVIDDDAEDGPEGRPDTSVFSLIQEVGVAGRHASSTQQTRKIVSNLSEAHYTWYPAGNRYCKSDAVSPWKETITLRLPGELRTTLRQSECVR
jgi:hypothetical protein